MKRIIYDVGACFGGNLSYFLLKADLVVAVEANPRLCAEIRASYSRAIAEGRLVVLNSVVLSDGKVDRCEFFLHNANALLSTCVPPAQERLCEYASAILPAMSIVDIVEKFGEPYYVKLDVEGADAALLRSMFVAGICPDYLSAEAHEIDVFALMVGHQRYRSFKVVEGATVEVNYGTRLVLDEHRGESVRHVFSRHSSGPFGKDIDGPWLNANELMAKLAADGFGWKDIHASAVDPPSLESPGQSRLVESVVLKVPDLVAPAEIGAVDPGTGLRVAIITPYYQESLEKLARCHQSVLGQTIACTHFLISDGLKRPEVASWVARHIEIGACHRDNGNTPRGVGAICAMNEGYDVILFLDADNWYSDDHVASVLYTHLASGAEVVFSDRFVVFPDGAVIDEPDPEDSSRLHVDTSCMAIFAPAFRSLAQWCLMPQELGPWCDRVMFALLTGEFKCVWSGYQSVFFETWYVGHFMLAGRDIPADAKSLSWRRLSGIKESVNASFAMRSYKTCLIDVGSEGAVEPGDPGNSALDAPLAD